MNKCGVCNDKDCYQACDVEELYWFLKEVVCDLGEVSAVVNMETAQELMLYALDEDAQFGIVNLNAYDYSDYYLLTLEHSEKKGFRIYAEPALLDTGKYVTSDALTFVDYNMPNRCKYIKDVTDNIFIKDVKFEFFSIGEIENESYEYEKSFDNGKQSAEIHISSNVRDFVDLMASLFEDYFE